MPAILLGMIRLAFLLIVFLCVFSVRGQAQASNIGLLSDADYKAFLLHVETVLPKWVTMAENMPPKRIRRTSYADGKILLDVGQIRSSISEQIEKRSLSGELALLASMQNLREMGKVLAWEQVMVSGGSVSSFGELDLELNNLDVLVERDVYARVALLEKNTCR